MKIKRTVKIVGIVVVILFIGKANFSVENLAVEKSIQYTKESILTQENIKKGIKVVIEQEKKALGYLEKILGNIAEYIIESG